MPCLDRPKNYSTTYSHIEMAYLLLEKGAKVAAADSVSVTYCVIAPLYSL